MERFSPFERAPRLAIAVSGGADSLCLAILAQGWAASYGGEAFALIVDHHLRPESTMEAEQVGAWLKDLGIPHHILTWTEAQGGAGLQARARQARYRLLETWCRAHDTLHLLTAHHRGDQAETYAMRAARGSGASGLAAMAAVKETRFVRVLRPLLETPKARLVASLVAQNITWVEDPSNKNPVFERVRLRRRLAEEGGESDLAEQASLQAGVRGVLELEAARLLARSVTGSSPHGVSLDATVLTTAPLGLAQRVLSDLVRRFGERAYPPHRESLAHALETLRAEQARLTLGGCLLTRKGGGLRIEWEKPRRTFPRKTLPSCGKSDIMSKTVL